MSKKERRKKKKIGTVDRIEGIFLQYSIRTLSKRERKYESIKESLYRWNREEITQTGEEEDRK